MVRNKELRQLALACAVIAALSAVGGFALHPAAGFLSLVYSAALVQECIKLIDRMLYGNVVIAFYKQDGTFCLERGTLVGYENPDAKAYQHAHLE